LALVRLAGTLRVIDDEGFAARVHAEANAADSTAVIVDFVQCVVAMTPEQADEIVAALVVKKATSVRLPRPIAMVVTPVDQERFNDFATRVSRSGAVRAVFTSREAASAWARTKGALWRASLKASAS
jgi:hypothetical protein